MFKTKDMSSVIGQTCGIYTILYECDHKSTDGHRLFHVKCNQCGFETDMRFDVIAKIKECKHTKSSGEQIGINVGEDWLCVTLSNIRRSTEAVITAWP